MGMNYTDEDYHQVTMDELFEIEVKPSLFAVSRIFADCRKQMNVKEFKTLAFALSHIDWTAACPDTLYCDKKKLAKAVGVNSDEDHLSVDLNDEIGEMPSHSFLRFKDKDKGIYDNGNFVRRITFFKNVVRIRLEDEYLKLFGGLDKGYITMWSGDIYKMSSERSVLLYELLRHNSDTRQPFNVGTISVRKFKEMYNIPKEAYTEKNGHFKRTTFEQRVIDPACEDLAKTEMIKLMIQEDGKYYEKVKRGGRVVAYRLFWTISDPKPQIEEKEAEDDIILNPVEPQELWKSALEDFEFSKEELEAIGSRLALVPQAAMYGNSAASGSIELDRYHFMDMRAKDIRLEDKKNHIRNKCKYLIKILENDYISKQ